MQPESISLFYQDAKSDKEYNVQLEHTHIGSVDHWTVNFQFGRRNGTLQTGTKTAAGIEYAPAKRIYDKLVAEKKGKGYREAGAAKAAPVPSAGQVAFVAPELLTELRDEREVAKLVADARFWMQEKRDGHRCLIVKQDGKLTRFTRTGKVAELPAGIYGELVALPFDSFILDGEIEGDWFIVFDALDLDGDMRERPYSERFRLLSQLAAQLKQFLHYVYPVATWEAEGEKATACVELFTARAEGIVFKDITAPYAPGRAHHFKFKFVKTLSAKVLRHTVGKESVAVGVLRDGKWLDVANISTHGHKLPDVGTIVEVRYLYATAGNRLYGPPVYLGVRDDVEESACQFSQLIFKQGVNTAAA